MKGVYFIINSSSLKIYFAILLISPQQTNSFSNSGLTSNIKKISVKLLRIDCAFS